MKTTFIIFLLLISLRAAAPNIIELCILQNGPINPFDKIIRAVGMVESKCNPQAINETEGAFGYFQIRGIRLLDYNQRTKSHYKLADMLDFNIAKRVFLYYASKIGIENSDKIIRRWNGSGSLTYQYLKKVSVYLNNPQFNGST